MTPMHEHLISADELRPHLGEGLWAIVDCRFDLAAPDWGWGEYQRGHIPGAVYANLERDLSGDRDGTNGRHPLPSIDAMAETFSAWGIDESVQVVAYDARGGGFAARLWWMLHYLGHTAVAVLDGGIQAWETAGFPIREGIEERERRRFSSRPRENMLLRVDDILSRVEGGDPALIDARARERYLGLEEPYDPVAGHIPGALHRYWGDNLDERGFFFPKDVLREQFERILQGRSPEEMALYCGSGVTACHNLLAMAIAGLPRAALYAGSWSEWCANDERPVSQGGESE